MDIESSIVSTSSRYTNTQSNLFGESSRQDEKLRFRTTNQAYNPNPDPKFTNRYNPYEYDTYFDNTDLDRQILINSKKIQEAQEELIELKSQINRRREYEPPNEPKKANGRSSLEILANLKSNLGKTNDGLANKEERKRARQKYW